MEMENDKINIQADGKFGFEPSAFLEVGMNNNVAIGHSALMANTIGCPSTSLGPGLKNCTFIGENAGADILFGDGIVIIGDNIRSLDKSQENVLFIGNKVAIGITLKGISFNLKDVITQLYGE